MEHTTNYMVVHRIRECVGRHVERRVPSLIGPCPHSRISTKMQTLQMWCEFSSEHGEEFQMILFAEGIEGTSRLRNPKLPARGRGAKMWGAVLRKRVKCNFNVHNGGILAF
jgi:hypothetical protein